LPVATSDSGKLIGAALAGLAGIWRDGYRYKKAGVILLDLHPAAAVQEGLFDKADTPRRTALMRTVDRLNTRFGRNTVIFAAPRAGAGRSLAAPGHRRATRHE
jgi:DNA polymerase V